MRSGHAQTSDLPIFDTNGQRITYTIGEDQLDGYDAPEVDRKISLSPIVVRQKISIKQTRNGMTLKIKTVNALPMLL